MFYGMIHEKAADEVSSITFEANGKKYQIHPNDSSLSGAEIFKLQNKIIARAKAILSHEDSIKKQIYTLYKKGNDKENIKKDKIENFDVVSPSHEEFKKDGFEVGIFFSNINQFYVTVDKSFKVYDDNSTYIY